MGVSVRTREERVEADKAVDKQAIESLNNYLQFLKGHGEIGRASCRERV